MSIAMGDNRDTLMTTDIEGELDYNVVVVLEKIEDAAISADRRAQTKQVMEDYRAKLARSEAHRKGERHRFRGSSDSIRRKKRGWSAISDRELKAVNCDERDRGRKARNKRDERTRKAKPTTPAPAIASVVITLEAFNDRVARLEVWLALPGHRQRHLRGRKTDIMRSWVVYQDHVAEHHRRPNPSQFAHTFMARFDQPMTQPMAQNRLRLLGTLMAASGPLR
jgi:hypothetical protein